MKKLSRIYSQLGTINFIQKQYEKALEYHRKSLEINQELNFKLGMSVNYNNIGNVYFSLKQYKSATENYLKSLEIKKEIHDDFGIAANLNNLGLIFSDQNKFQKALDFHNDALDKYRELGDKTGIANCITNIANDYLGDGNFHSAIKFAEKGLQFSKEINLKQTQTEAYRILSEAYAALNQFKKAWQYQDIIHEISLKYNVDEDLIKSVIQVESSFNPNAVSPKGAVGLMQLIPETAEEEKSQQGKVIAIGPGEKVKKLNLKKGDKIITFHQVRHLARNHDVAFAQRLGRPEVQHLFLAIKIPLARRVELLEHVAHVVAAAWLNGFLVMTVKLEVNYLQAVPLGKEVFVEAWVDRSDEKKVQLKSRLTDGAGVTFSKGKGLFIQLSKERIESMGSVPEGLL